MTRAKQRRMTLRPTQEVLHLYIDPEYKVSPGNKVDVHTCSL